MEHTALAILIRQLGQRARAQQVVATHTLDSGLVLLLYPLPQGYLLGLGWGATQVHRLTLVDVLRRRVAALSRYGAWLPATLLDGSFYLVRRLSEVEQESDDTTLSEEALVIARELLL